MLLLYYPNYILHFLRSVTKCDKCDEVSWNSDKQFRNLFKDSFDSFLTLWPSSDCSHCSHFRLQPLQTAATAWRRIRTLNFSAFLKPQISVSRAVIRCSDTADASIFTSAFSLRSRFLPGSGVRQRGGFRPPLLSDIDCLPLWSSTLLTIEYMQPRKVNVRNHRLCVSPILRKTHVNAGRQEWWKP